MPDAYILLRHGVFAVPAKLALELLRGGAGIPLTVGEVLLFMLFPNDQRPTVRQTFGWVIGFKPRK